MKKTLLLYITLMTLTTSTTFVFASNARFVISTQGEPSVYLLPETGTDEHTTHVVADGEYFFTPTSNMISDSKISSLSKKEKNTPVVASDILPTFFWTSSIPINEKISFMEITHQVSLSASGWDIFLKNGTPTITDFTVIGTLPTIPKIIMGTESKFESNDTSVATSK